MNNLKRQRELLDEIASVLALRPPRRQPAPLEHVLELLASSGGYASAAVYLNLDGEAVCVSSAGEAQPSRLRAEEPQSAYDESAERRAKTCQVGIRRGAVQVGTLVVTSSNPFSFGAGELALLKQIARRLATFFANAGKRYVRKAKRMSARLADPSLDNSAGRQLGNCSESPIHPVTQ